MVRPDAKWKLPFVLEVAGSINPTRLALEAYILLLFLGRDQSHDHNLQLRSAIWYFKIYSARFPALWRTFTMEPTPRRLGPRVI